MYNEVQMLFLAMFCSPLPKKIPNVNFQSFSFNFFFEGGGILGRLGLANVRIHETCHNLMCSLRTLDITFAILQNWIQDYWLGS